MSIYIVSHLRLRQPAMQGYRVIYVGPMAGSKSPDSFAATDADLPSNISHKNKTFCELTALHQIAQLSAGQPQEIVGLVHYRRRFINGPDWVRKLIRTTQKVNWSRGFSNWLLSRFELSLGDAETLLGEYDVLLPKVTQLKKTIRQSYIDAHVAEDWIKLKAVIDLHFPEYSVAFEGFQNQRQIHLYNMFVARAEFLRGYATWLFAVMDKLEQVIDPVERDTFQKRVFGFISERLFNVYLFKHSTFKCLHMPVVQIFNESVVCPQ